MNFFSRLSTSRGRAYSEGRIGYKKYELFYLLKGIGDIPVGHSESTMLALAVKYGYEIPDALLEVFYFKCWNDCNYWTFFFYFQFVFS